MALVDLAVETLLAGSPILWTVMGVEIVALALLALSWTKLGPTIRLAIPLLGLVGIIVWASLRLGSWADPALRMASVALPRIGVALAIVAMLSAVGLLFGLALVRRAWLIGAVVGVLALYAAVPFGRAAVAGVPLIQVMAGALDWQRLPAWLHGGFVATQIILPIGLLAGVAALFASISRRTRATWTTAGLLLVAGAFVVQSAELSRAGRTHLAGALAAPVLTQVSAVHRQTPPRRRHRRSPLRRRSGTRPPLPRAPRTPGASEGTPSPSSSSPAPAPGAVAIAQPGQPIVNKAIELSVTGHRTASSVGGRRPKPAANS